MSIGSILAGLGQVLLPIAGGVVGEIQSAPHRDARRRLLEELVSGYQDIDLPEFQNLISDAGQVRADPELVNAQKSVLAKLANLENGGLNLTDRAALNDSLGAAARQETAGRNAILQGMRARGTAGSGNELAMMLSNQQAAAERGASTGLSVAAQAQRRALEALMQRGQMAGQMRSQGFAEQDRTAQARDNMKRYNQGLMQQNFQNTMARQGGISQGLGQRVQGEMYDEDQARKLWGGLGQAGGELAKGFGSGSAGGDFTAEQVRKLMGAK